MGPYTGSHSTNNTLQFNRSDLTTIPHLCTCTWCTHLHVHGEVTDPDQLRDLTPQFWPSRGGFTGSHVSVNANSYPLMKNPSPGDNKFITFEKLLFWSIFYTLIHILHIKLMSLTYRIEIFGLWIQCECSHYYKMKSNINN